MILSEQRLNRALLSRQMLLEPASCSIPEALERMGGLQNQYALSGYIGLWARLERFSRGDLDAALHARQVVQATLMRTTIHLVSAGDYFAFSAALRQARQQSWMRAGKRGDAGPEMERLAAETRRLLSDGPVKRADLVEALGGIDNFTWVGVGLWVEMVRVPPSGTWENRRADLYALAEQWLEPSDPSPEEGIDHLLTRYLAGFGPASLKDIVSWSGLPSPVVRQSLSRMKLQSFRDETGTELLDLPGAPLPAEETPAPVKLLPTWEAALLVHARRTQFLPERFRSLVFHTKIPHSVNTFTVDGRVAGIWRHSGGKVIWEPFEPLPDDAGAEVEAESGRIARLFD